MLLHFLGIVILLERPILGKRPVRTLLYVFQCTQVRDWPGVGGTSKNIIQAKLLGGT